MADFATVDDVNGRLIGRDLTDGERVKIPALLADASAKMRERVPDIDTRQPDTAKGVCCAMVLRVVLNPEGKRQQSVDDYSYTTDSARSSGELYLTPQELADLRPAVGGRAFSIVPGSP
ncbi:Gp19/Gp15/Gp42 family protein [Streptomyces sp. NBC_01477]|uniref:Gp19/Gp15/Gp42 family protein n=1 Tax=Streptomyces sp. NBC_01477 TaxID=2976015 RepID=UPI002E376205|nr:Gp19/Gp15/Gp42 family protein [Streptomyces sp. NBC_01477]